MYFALRKRNKPIPCQKAVFFLRDGGNILSKSNSTDGKTRFNEIGFVREEDSNALAQYLDVRAQVRSIRGESLSERTEILDDSIQSEAESKMNNTHVFKVKITVFKINMNVLKLRIDVLNVISNVFKVWNKGF